MNAFSDKTFGSWVAFWMISLMHDNRLLPIFKNPNAVLKASGLSPGQQVLEVGCGPGFFTLPAAEIVGAHGHVYVMDVNPWAIQRVKQKIEVAGMENVTAKLCNAAKSGLPDQSVDLAFLFGLPRIAGGKTPLIKELGRTVKPGGAVVFQKSRIEEKALSKDMSEAGFSLAERKRRFLIFRRR